ncbi:MAG: ABC transporter ATP-binding protein [Phycisphaerae bacterium]|nr:ABC transporter ATP-binding protein [Phycisphaerae bacterium]
MLSRLRGSRSRYQDYLRLRLERRRQGDHDRLDEASLASPPRGPAPPRPRRARSFFTLFGAFWRLLRGHTPTILGALATLSLSTFLVLGVPGSTKVVLDFVITDNPGPGGLPGWVPFRSDRHALLWAIGIGMVALSALSVLVGMWGRYHMTRITKLVQADVRARAFAHAGRLPLHALQRHKTGGLVSIIREDAGRAAELLFGMIYNPFRAIIQLLGTLAILAWVDWTMLAGALLLLPIVWVSHKTWIERIRPVHKDIGAQRQRLDAHATEVFQGIRVVRGFVRDRRERNRFAFAAHLMARQEMLVWWWSRIVDVAWSVLIPAASAGLIIYGGYAVLDARLTIGDVMMFSTYLLMLLGPLETLTSTAATIQQNLAGFDRVLDLLDEPEEFAQSRAGLAATRASARGHIQIRDLTFAYPAPPGKPPRQPVLRDISLGVRPGQTIALVGASGSGKTTLCNLVARFYDPTSGSIHLDGHDLRGLNVDSYRRLLGIVEQDVFLFDGTVAENIAYGARAPTEEAIRHAADLANAHEFISRLDRGYDTLIGERGVRLSGGQKQRLAIARALLADPLILILDEATSNLDAESEALIQSSLARLMRGRTSFVIAHRLSTIRSADLIVVLEDGRIIETGRHAELLARGGRYSNLLRTQLEHAERAPEAGAPEVSLDPDPVR